MIRAKYNNHPKPPPGGYRMGILADLEQGAGIRRFNSSMRSFSFSVVSYFEFAEEFRRSVSNQVINVGYIIYLSNVTLNLAIPLTLSPLYDSQTHLIKAAKHLDFSSWNCRTRS